MNAVLAVVVPEELLAVLAAVSVGPSAVAAPDTAVTAVHAEQLVDRLVLAVPLALCHLSLQLDVH